MPTDDQVLVHVYATSINASDYFSMRGSPWLVRFFVGFPRSRDYILGWDVAGCVEAVGNAVTQFRPGDAVFGSVNHAFAEYVVAAADRFALKPTNLTFEQAAAVPTAGITALQGLRDVGKVQPGQQVLINSMLQSPHPLARSGPGTIPMQRTGHRPTAVCEGRDIIPEAHYPYDVLPGRLDADLSRTCRKHLEQQQTAMMERFATRTGNWTPVPAIGA